LADSKNLFIFVEKYHIMKKVLLNLSMFLLVTGAAFGQATGKYDMPSKTQKSGKHLLASEFVEAQAVVNNRAEGDIIWGSEVGEGDFSVGSNWATSNLSNPPHGFTISMDPSAPPNFTQTASLLPLNFSGATNGYALCDSDVAGQGSTTNARIEWAGDAIDCSAFENVSMRFTTATRNFASSYFVLVSNDNGATWNEIEVLQHITTNVNTTNPETVEVNISEYAGEQSQVKIGFRYEADWGWFWAIDDVLLFETWNYDLAVNNPLSSMGVEGFKYTHVPVGQVTPGLKMGFGVEVRNLGAMPIMSALVATQGGFTATGASVNVEPQASGMDSLFILDANGYDVPNTVGTYNIDLSLEIPVTVQDESATERTMSFSVSPLIYAGDDYDGTPASLDGGFFGWLTPDGDPGICRYFEINADGTIGRMHIAIANVSQANQGDYIGNELFGELYRFDENQNDFVFFGLTEAHTVVAGDFGNLVTLTFEEALPVSAGDLIVALGSSSEGALVPIAYSGRQNRRHIRGKDGGLVNVSSTSEYNNVPVVRLDMGDYTNIENNNLVSQNVMVYPNPTNDNATVSFSLTEQANVTIVVRDLSGKVVYATDNALLSSGQHAEIIDLNEMSQGMYTVTITANGGQTTQKLIKK
jgi:hypothetical protein